MTSAPSDLSGHLPSPGDGLPHVPRDGPTTALKMLVAGGFGVGKTTLVGAVSEIRPLCTEEVLTDVGSAVDDLEGIEQKATTTVAMDFGRITFPDGIGLYLFGTPGQERFWFMWDEISYGAVGAIVLVDTHRLAVSFPSIDYFEHRDLPFIVAVNCFDGARTHSMQQVRNALDLDPNIPIVLCDVRNRESAKQVLIALMEHAMRRAHPEPERADA